MSDDLVGKETAVAIAHGLAHLDGEPSIRTGRGCQRLDMRIDRLPLAHPIAAHAVVAADMAALQPVRPDDVGVQSGKNAVYVAGIEAGIDALEQVFLPRHRRPQSPRMALAMMFFWISLEPP